MRLKGKKAIVTGGSRGIGRAVALLFAKEGADVGILDLNLAAAKEAAREIEKNGVQGLAFECDVTNHNQVKSVVAKFHEITGAIDILVNNAGVSKPSMLLKMSEEDWDMIIDVHLKAAFNTSQAVGRYMKEKKYGKIINVISTAGLYGTIGQINYSSAKAGIIGFTKSASREFGRYGINVNVVCPGITKTEMTRTLQSDEKLRQTYESRIQLGRFAEPEEMAPAFLFLASDEAGYITGQVLGVDGGYIG